MSALLSPTVLWKHPIDDALYLFEFGNWICDGDTLSSIVAVDIEPSGAGHLVAANPAVYDASTVSAKLSAGLADTNYLITITVQTEFQGTNVIARDFLLKVRDDRPL